MTSASIEASKRQAPIVNRRNHAVHAKRGTGVWDNGPKTIYMLDLHQQQSVIEQEVIVKLTGAHA